jgi:hypothetical protein
MGAAWLHGSDPVEAVVCGLGADHILYFCCTMLCVYLQEYYNRIMKKLKEVGATADRTNFYV